MCSVCELLWELCCERRGQPRRAAPPGDTGACFFELKQSVQVFGRAKQSVQVVGELSSQYKYLGVLLSCQIKLSLAQAIASFFLSSYLAPSGSAKWIFLNSLVDEVLLKMSGWVG